MSRKGSASEVELPSYLYNYKIDEFDASHNFNYDVGWKNNERDAESEYVDGDVYDDVCDGQSQASVFSPSMKQTVRNIDGVLNEIRLHSSPDPGNGKYYSGNYDDDNMSDVSGITTSNLLKELNSAHKSFLDSIGRVQNSWCIQSSKDNDNTIFGERKSAMTASDDGTDEYRGNVFLWAENGGNHNDDQNGDYCNFFIDYDRETECTPDRFRNRKDGKLSRKVHLLRSIYRSMKRRKEQHSYVQQLPHFSRKTRLRSVSIYCAIFGFLLVLTSVILGIVTTVSNRQDHIQPSSALDSHNTTTVNFTSTPTMQTVRSPRPTFESSNSSEYQGALWSSSTSGPVSISTLSPTTPVDRAIDNDDVDDVHPLDVNSNREPPLLPGSSPSSIGLPVSGVSAKNENLSLSSPTLPISSPATHYGHHYEIIYVSTNENRVTPSTPTSSLASKIPISGVTTKTKTNSSEVDNNNNNNNNNSQGSTEQRAYLPTNDKHVQPFSDDDPANMDEKKANNSVGVRRMLRFSTGERKFEVQ